MDRRAMILTVATIALVRSGSVRAAGAAVRHRLTDVECATLAGCSLDASQTLREDIALLLGNRFRRFLDGLSDRRPLERLDDDLLGEGIRPGSLGAVGSFFVAGRDGALFAALKSGPHGEEIETFGDAALLGPSSHHRFLEFADLDE